MKSETLEGSERREETRNLDCQGPRGQYIYMSVIALSLHANFTPFIDQLNYTFFLTHFHLPQDFHKHHEIPEDHILKKGHTTNAYD